MTHRWSYIFADLVTNKYLGQVPLQGVSFSSQLNSAGSFSAKLLLTDPTVQKTLAGVEVGTTLVPTGRTIIYVDCDGVLWPEAYIVWTTSYDSPSKVLTIGGVGTLSYFAQRVIAWNSAFYNSVDQLTIAESVITTAQQQLGGNIGVTVPSTTSGVPFTVNWDPSQLTSVSQALNTMATQAGNAGFDYAITCTYSAGLPVKTLTLSYPRSGRIAGSTGLVIDANEGGSLGYVWPTDSTQQAVTVYGVGAGSGPGSSVRAAQMYQPLITAGYPLLEATLQRSDIINQSVLQGVTRTFLAARAYPVTLPVFTLSTDSNVTQFGTYGIGDDIRVRVDPDPFFANGVDEYKRISAVTVTPGDDGVGTQAITVQDPPVEGGGSATPPRIYPSSLPAGVSLAHSYAGATQLYNGSASWPTWTAARNAAYAGTGVARLNVIGDSISYGAYNVPPYLLSPPGQLRSLFLNVGHVQNPGTGMEMFYGPGVSSPDPRVALGGFVDTTDGPVATSITSNTIPADFYLTPGVAYTTYTLWYHQKPSGGTFTYQLISGSTYFPVVTINTAGTDSWQQVTNTAPGGVTNNTVFVNVTAGACTFGAWEVSNGGPGVKVGRLAEPGMTAHNVVAQTTPTFNLPSGVADLAVIQLGINDYGVQSLTFQADLTSLVTAAQSAGSDVLLVVTQPDRTLLTKPQSDYSKAIYAVADAKNVRLLDLYDRWDPNVISDPSFYADGIIHPSSWGAADIANAIYQVVK